jgi:hypothetical protein
VKRKGLEVGLNALKGFREIQLGLGLPGCYICNFLLKLCHGCQEVLWSIRQGILLRHSKELSRQEKEES